MASTSESSFASLLSMEPVAVLERAVYDLDRTLAPGQKKGAFQWAVVDLAAKYAPFRILTGTRAE